MNILLLLSFTYLTLPHNGKVFSYGTAFSTVKNEPENLFWNPAGMGKNGYIASAFDYSGNIMGAFGKTWEKNTCNIGLGIQFMRSETMDKTDMTGNITGTFNFQSAMPVIAGNWKTNKYIVGVKAFFPYTSVDEYASYGMGIELGGIYTINDMFSFSLYVRNLGQQAKAFLTEKESFPTESRFGGLLQKKGLSFSLEYSSKFKLCSFASYDINEIFGIIIGYNGRTGELNGIEASNLSGFSFGANIKHKSINISVGSVFNGPQGLSKTISISFIQ